MGFRRPDRLRHLGRDPGLYTHAIVGWVLIVLIMLTGMFMGGVLSVVGAVVYYIAVR